jgi:hypothetical protein
MHHPWRTCHSWFVVGLSLQIQAEELPRRQERKRVEQKQIQQKRSSKGAVSEANLESCRGS